MMYDYIKTAFGVMIGLLTGDKLLLISLIAVLLFVLWVTLSLVFSFEKRFERNARKINSFILVEGVKKNNVYQLNQMIAKMPSSFVRGWSTFKYKKRGLPSEYIKREDSLDLELHGGMYNQNRTIMRTYSYTVFAFLLLCSVAIIGKSEPLTGYALAESLLVPFIYLAVIKGAFYIYTAIRQNQYRLAVDSFDELLKTLDSLVVGTQANAGYNLFEQDTDGTDTEIETSDLNEDIKLEKILPVASEVPKIIEPQESEPLEQIGDTEMEILPEEDEETESAYVEQKPISEPKTENNVFFEEDKEKVSTNKKRGRPKLEIQNGEPVIIRSDEEFEIALERAEKLMRKSEQSLSPSQAKRTEKSLKELIDAMNKYREGDNK